MVPRADGYRPVPLSHYTLFTEGYSSVLQKLAVRLGAHGALLCSLTLALSMLAAWPFAETGMHDDWSYAQTARVLAQSGHVVFNGWGAPTLGIMLLPAALLVKLFGFSYTVVRLSTMLVALVSGALLQRTLVRCGITERNASLGTLTFVLSPVALPVATGFLSDNWSQLALLVCFYCCLRAVGGATDHARSLWIVVAALGNALLGTSRQIAWLGVLVMVPSALWLLRSRRRPVLHGTLAWLAGLGVIGATLAWFRQKPYVLPEHFTLRYWPNLVHHPDFWIRPALEVPMLLLPVLLPFLPQLREASRPARLIAAALFAGVLCFVAYKAHLHSLRWWLIPFMTEHGDIFGARGVYASSPVWGDRPAALPDWFRALGALVTVAGFLGWAATSFTRRNTPRRHGGDPMRHALPVLLLPFTAAYLLTLLPRASLALTIDRYLLPLLVVAIVFLLRQYQAANFQPNLPGLAWVAVLCIALFSIATLQDAFGLYRTVEAAAAQLRAAGVPREHFDGGWEFDGTTQILVGGYVHQTGIRTPQKPLLYGHRRTGPCQVAIDVWIPDVAPEYALSYDPNGCGGATSFKPLSYRRLLSPHEVSVYIVHSPDHSGLHGYFPGFQ